MSRLADKDSSCGSRLSALGSEVDKLFDELANLELVPYSRTRSEGASEGGRYDVQTSHTTTVALPVVASRIGLPSKPIRFGPMPYLSALSQLA